MIFLLLMSALLLATTPVDAVSKISLHKSRRNTQYRRSKGGHQPFLCQPIASDSIGAGEVQISTPEAKNPIELLQGLNIQKEEERIKTGGKPTVGRSNRSNKTDTVTSTTQQQEEEQRRQLQQQQSLDRDKYKDKQWSKPTPKTTGLANIYWRAVDVEDLRTHPYFSSLPPSSDVFVTNASEYSLFRQDSWQWGALHSGRLTTARAAACIGFYESESAKILKVPRSLSGHSKAVHAREHLQEQAPENWDFFE
mmetsp:Transcript_6318/g.6483  ORF Transcript_6318/g.6483 Transcript_6318/m.6483 type:complete len:252 (+) Transcript_6318:205-960(+)